MSPTLNDFEKVSLSVIAAPVIGIVIALFTGVYLPHVQGHHPAGLIGTALLAIVATFFCFAVAAAGPHRHHR